MSQFILVVLLGMVSHAYATSSDFCSQIQGHWRGFYTIKDQSLCELFDGCTHTIEAQVYVPPTDLIVNTIYEVNITPSAGTGGLFEISCDNGVIYSRYYPGNTIRAFCDEQDGCEVVYEDRLLWSKMTKIK